MKTNSASLFLAATAAATFLIGQIPARAATDPTNELAAMYAKSDASADNKDVDALISFHSPDFIQLDQNGKLETNDQERARLQELFGSVGPMTVTTHIDKCDYAGSTATVVITQHVKTSVADPDSGKQVSVSGDLQARELWTKGPTGWKMDVAQTLVAGNLKPDL